MKYSEQVTFEAFLTHLMTEYEISAREVGGKFEVPHTTVIHWMLGTRTPHISLRRQVLGWIVETGLKKELEREENAAAAT